MTLTEKIRLDTLEISEILMERPQDTEILKVYLPE